MEQAARKAFVARSPALDLETARRLLHRGVAARKVPWSPAVLALWTLLADPPKKKTGSDGPADTPVQLLEKPKPEYTADGRNLKIEGDVVIDLVFLANGTVQINRVVSGLGHGLDESAVRAAQNIRFKPAKRLTEPVDFPARVRIEFRLAY